MTESTLTFAERYDEYRALGYPDWQIAKKMGYTFLSFARQLCRNNIPADRVFMQMVHEERIRTKSEGAQQC